MSNFESPVRRNGMAHGMSQSKRGSARTQRCVPGLSRSVTGPSYPSPELSRFGGCRVLPSLPLGACHSGDLVGSRQRVDCVTDRLERCHRRSLNEPVTDQLEDQ
jgi:hypothetical protein